MLLSFEKKTNNTNVFNYCNLSQRLILLFETGVNKKRMREKISKRFILYIGKI